MLGKGVRVVFEVRRVEPDARRRSPTPSARPWRRCLSTPHRGLRPPAPRETDEREDGHEAA